MKCKYCNSVIEKDDLFCPNCGKKVIRGRQCIKCGEELEEGSDFCPYCGTQQSPKGQGSPRKIVQNDPKKQKDNGLLSKPWVIIILLVLICLGLYFLFFNDGDKKAKHDDLEQEEVVSESKKSPIDSDSVYRVNAIDGQLKEDSLMKVAKQKSDSLAYLKDSLNNKKEIKKLSKENNQAAKPSSSSRQGSASSGQPINRRNPAIQTGTKNMGYATYKGVLVSGKPHGVNGRMVYKTSHLIDSRDPKARYAEPGDYVIGEYYDGHLVQGIWYDANNQVKGSIIIGR